MSNGNTNNEEESGYQSPFGSGILALLIILITLGIAFFLFVSMIDDEESEEEMKKSLPSEQRERLFDEKN